jgi:hypothetical protein
MSSHPSTVEEIYLRTTRLSDDLVSDPRFAEVSNLPISSELLGQIHAISQAAAQLQTFASRLPEPIAEIWSDVQAKTSRG